MEEGGVNTALDDLQCPPFAGGPLCYTPKPQSSLGTPLGTVAYKVLPYNQIVPVVGHASNMSIGVLGYYTLYILKADNGTNWFYPIGLMSGSV